ncbi:MAG: hypothetical protein DYH17_13285 [Xanthomonadales bacterium PRO6]|nr:hypothetical protein [Xanthomonadales bacterium]MCE7932332.1 hypothetical protein [Xanthomonadales bacterium PRO6]
MLPAAAQELWKALRKADRKAAKARVAALRKRLPDAELEELHRLLVQSKCLQAGAIGALSAVVELVPGAGRLAGVFLGPVLDIGTVTALQSELVLETFALYEVDLGDAGERFAILAIAATNVGATHASSIVAKLLKRYAGALVGGFVLKRALPIAKIATVATKNIALTYAIGMRAQAVAKFRDADLEEWPKLMRQVTNIDESTLVEWATGAARTAIDQVQESARSWVGRVTGLLPTLPSLPTLDDLKRLMPGSAPDPAPEAGPPDAPRRRAKRAEVPTAPGKAPATRRRMAAKSRPEPKPAPRTRRTGVTEGKPRTPRKRV